MAEEAKLEESEYVRLAQRTLRRLIDALDSLTSDAFEAELANDIVTLEFSDGSKYVINSHRAARQIWMAAERNAWHFDYETSKDAWISAKSGEELRVTIEAVLARKLGHPVSLGNQL